jgi:hypothetical protein
MLTALLGSLILLSLKFDKSKVTTAIMAGFFVYGIDYNIKELNSKDLHYIHGCFQGYYDPPRGNISLVAKTVDGEIKFKKNLFASFRESDVKEGDCGLVGYFYHFGTRHLMSFEKNR